MAVTDHILIASLRLGNTNEEFTEVQRLLPVCQAIVEERAPNAPEAIKDEAVIRIAAHLFDKPNFSDGAGYSSILRGSGAGELLLPYVSIRATSTGRSRSNA